MSQGAGRSDLLSLKRELLDSARLDVKPLPASVRYRALLAATLAGAASAATGAASASASTALVGSTSVVFGLAKLGGIGALLVSVGTATYYATEGVWHAPQTLGSGRSEPEPRTWQRTPSPGAALPGVVSTGAHTLNGVPELQDVPSPGVRASTSESARALNPASAPRAADVAAVGATSKRSLVRLNPSMTDANADSSAPMRPTSVDVPVLLEPSPREIQTSETLRLELALLDSARARLAAGNAGAASFQLDRYAREFPSGALQPEAAFLRIQALSQAGQHDAAARVGRHFLGQYPASPHADRVRALIESHTGDPNP